MHRPLALIVGASMAAFAITATAAQPKASGVYPLVPGIFVAQGNDCGNPPNAIIKSYDGKGIGTAHTSACVAHVVSTKKAKGGTTFEVSQTCNDAGDGSGKPFTEKQTVVIKDATHFAITSQDNTRYDYCPVTKLPPELRSAAPSGSKDA